MPASRWAGLALFVLAAAVAVVYAIYPLIATYDALYALVWGREFWDGQALSFEAYRAPTEHPLSLAVGIVLAPLGFEAARLMTIVILIAFVGLAAGVYRLGRVAFSPLVGLVAAALVVGLYEFFFYAIRAYVDVPFLAFVIWAAALEAERPRRGGIVWVLLGLAGLLRPEAWLLIGLYWLWLAKDAGWTERLRMAAYAAVAPLLWIAVDFVVTGQPLFSLTHTGDYVASLNRDKPLPELPETVVSLLTSLLSRPWLLAAAIGVPLGFWLVRRRAIMPAALLGIGIATFLIIGALGFAAIPRYLLLPAAVATIFAALPIAGWTLLSDRPGLRRAWIVAGAVLAVLGAAWTVRFVDPAEQREDLAFRAAATSALERILDDPRVRAGMKCGPVWVPSDRLVPDVRWIADLPQNQVRSRSDQRFSDLERRGVAILPTNRRTLLRHGIWTPIDSPLIVVPSEGFERVLVTPQYAAYVRC